MKPHLFPACPRPDNAYGIYALTERDRPAVIAHLLSLSPEQRHSRFGLALSDEKVSAIVSRLPLAGTSLGYFVWGELRAMVTLVPLDTEGERVELAVSAHPSLQGQGMGSRLVDQALETAEIHGVQAVDILYQRSNTPMMRIVGRLPGRREAQGGEGSLAVDVRAWANRAICPMGAMPA